MIMIMPGTRRAKWKLPPGNYRIVAQAAKYGTVRVPVLIASHQVTRVNLTGTLRLKGELAGQNEYGLFA